MESLERKEKTREKVFEKLEYIQTWENCEWSLNKMIISEEKGELTLEKLIELLNNKECCGCSGCCY